MTERAIVATVDIDDIDWPAIEELFGGGEEHQLDAFVRGIKAGGGEVTLLATVANVVCERGETDADAIEQIVQLPDGRVVFTEMLEGQHLITGGPVDADIVDLFLDKIEAILTATS